MLWNIYIQSHVITYEACITQVYFLMLFAGLDDFLLTVMAYDRFAAICHPLYYVCKVASLVSDSLKSYEL